MNQEDNLRVQQIEEQLDRLTKKLEELEVKLKC